MSYKLNPVKLKGIVESRSGENLDLEILDIFWLLTSALGNEVSVQGVNYNFVKKHNTFFSYMQKLGFVLERHVYGYDFSGSAVNPVSIRASEAQDILPMLALVGSLSREIVAIRIDDPNLTQYVSDICEMMNSLGADSALISDSLYIKASALLGGIVHTKGDYRFVFACALASAYIDEEIIISHYECVNDAYPGFWKTFKEHTVKTRK